MNIDHDQYFEVIRKKTASLISACTASGAKSVGVNDETVSRMRLFGEYVGIAFQIKDDLFDYQPKGLIGKPTANDIKEKKLTLPLIYALEQASSTEKRMILKTIKRHNKNAEKVKTVIEFVNTRGGLEYSAQKMHEYKDKALEILAQYPNSEVKSALIDLVNYTIERNK